MTSVEPGRRSTRSSGVVPPAEVRAIGCADDFILDKVYELFCPIPPLARPPRIIPDAEPSHFSFQRPLDLVRSDAEVFEAELKRMCNLLLTADAHTTDGPRLHNLIVAWRTTVFSPSIRIEFEPRLGRLVLVARTKLSKAVITGANAFLIDLEHSRDLVAIGMQQSSLFLDWSEKDPDRVQVWYGPMRMVPNGCKTCRNVAYETFSTRRLMEIEPARTTHQPLAALKVVLEGQQLWGKSAALTHQCGCPMKVRKAVPPRLMSTPTSSAAGQTGIVLRVPASAGSTKRDREASGSPAPPSKRPRESSAWADEEVPRKIAPRVRLAETESPSSSVRGSPEPGSTSPQSLPHLNVPSSPDAVARPELQRASKGLPVPDFELHMTATSASHSPARLPMRFSSARLNESLPPGLDVPASAATGLHTPPSSRSIAISLFGIDSDDPPQDRFERASIAYHTESADDERFMSAEEGPPTDVDEEILGSIRPESFAVQTVTAVAATVQRPHEQRQIIGLGLVASTPPTPAASSSSDPAKEPTGARENNESPASDDGGTGIVEQSTDIQPPSGDTHIRAPPKKPAAAQHLVGTDIVPPSNKDALDADKLLLGSPAAAVPPRKRKPARPKEQPGPNQATPSASVAPVVAAPTKRTPGRPRNPLLAGADSATAVDATGSAAAPRTQPLADHRTLPRITIGAQPIHIGLGPPIGVGTPEAPPRSPSGCGWDNSLERDVALAMSAQVEKRLHLLDEEKHRMSKENKRLAARVAELEAASSQLRPSPSNGELPTPGTDTPLGNAAVPVSSSPPDSPLLPDVGFPPLRLDMGTTGTVGYQQAPTSSARDDELRHRGKWPSRLPRGDNNTRSCLAKHLRVAQQDVSHMNLATLAAASSAVQDAIERKLPLADADVCNLNRAVQRRFAANGEPVENGMDVFEDVPAAANSATHARLVLEVEALRKAQEDAIDPAVHARLLAEVETFHLLQEDTVNARLHDKTQAEAKAASIATAEVERRLSDIAAELEKARTALDIKTAELDTERSGRLETKATLASKMSELRRSIERVKTLEVEQARDRVALRDAQAKLAQEREGGRSAAQDQVKTLTIKANRLEAENKIQADRLKTWATESRDKLNKAGFVVREKDQRIQALTARLKEVEERERAKTHHDEHVRVQLYAEFEQRQDRIANLTSDNERLRKEAISWEEKWARLESENQRLRADVRSFRDQATSRPLPVQHQDELKRVQEDRSVLKIETAQLKIENAQLKTDNAKLTGELRAKGEVELELKRAKDGAAALGAKYEGLQAELRRLTNPSVITSRHPPELLLPTPATPATPSFPVSQSSRASAVNSGGDASHAPRPPSAVAAPAETTGSYSPAAPSREGRFELTPSSVKERLESRPTPPLLAGRTGPIQPASLPPNPPRTSPPPPPTRTPPTRPPVETTPLHTEGTTLSRDLLASMSMRMASKGLHIPTSAPAAAGASAPMAPHALPPSAAASTQRTQQASLLPDSPIPSIRKDDTWQPPPKGAQNSCKQSSSMGQRANPVPGAAEFPAQPVQSGHGQAAGTPTDRTSLAETMGAAEDPRTIVIPSRVEAVSNNSTNGQGPNPSHGLGELHALSETQHRSSLRRSSSPGFRYSPSRPITPASWGNPHSIAEASVHGREVDPALPARPRVRSPSAQGWGRRHRSRPKGAKPGRNGEDRRDRGDPVHMALPMRMATRDARDERWERDEQAWREREHAYWLDERRSDRDWRDDRRDERDRWEPRRDGNHRGSLDYALGQERSEWRDGGGRR